MDFVAKHFISFIWRVFYCFTLELGLNFYPVPEDGSILIKYRPHKWRNDEAIKQSLDQVLQRKYEFSAEYL